MLYSLIPPIIVVLSAIGIVVFLVKKSSKVKDIQEENLQLEKHIFVERGVWGNFVYKIKSIKGEDIRHFFLGILEQITRRSRIIFLKLESKFGEMSNDIRAKRQARTNRKANEVKAAENKAKDIFEKLKRYRIGKNEQKTGITPEIKKAYMDEEERIFKPMLSEKIVVPESMQETKDKLEELLIERIAVNPRDIEAYERLGEYYMEIKSYNDAKECFKQVIKLNPTNKNVKYKIRRLEYLLSK